jgi:hypothetical protein
VVLEYNLHLHSKIQILHHNQDHKVVVDLVLQDILMVVLVSSLLVEVEEVLAKLIMQTVMMEVHLTIQLLMRQMQMHRSLAVEEEDIILEMRQMLYKTPAVEVVVDKDLVDLLLVVMVVLVSS